MTKKIRPIVSVFFYLVIVVLFLSGCGGGGGEPATTVTTPPPVTGSASHTPEISNLQYSPQTATQNQGNGTVSVTVTFKVKDQGGDITRVTVNNYDTNYQLLSTDNIPVQNSAGIVSGSIDISKSVDTTTVANYRFEVYIIDIAGNSSNKLTGTFSVTAVPPVTPSPAPSYSGTWNGMGYAPQTGSVSTTAILSQSGNSVSGTWDGYPMTGTISGGQLTFTITPFMQDGVSYTGGGSATVTGNSMSGTVQFIGKSGSTTEIINGTYTLTRSVANALYITDDAPAIGFFATVVDAIPE